MPTSRRHHAFSLSLSALMLVPLLARADTITFSGGINAFSVVQSAPGTYGETSLVPLPVFNTQLGALTAVNLLVRGERVQEARVVGLAGPGGSLRFVNTQATIAADLMRPDLSSAFAFAPLVFNVQATCTVVGSSCAATMNQNGTWAMPATGTPGSELVGLLATGAPLFVRVRPQFVISQGPGGAAGYLTAFNSLSLAGMNYVVEYTYAPVPEPGALALMLAGVVVVGGAVRKRRSASIPAT
jgi:PEP-CTERM motif